MSVCVAQMVKNLPAMREALVQFPGRERSPGEGNGYPFQCSCLENPMDREAWYSPRGCKRLDTTERLSLLHCRIETKKATRDILGLQRAELGISPTVASERKLSVWRQRY